MNIDFDEEIKIFKTNFNDLEKILKNKCKYYHIYNADKLSYYESYNKLSKFDNLIKYNKHIFNELGKIRNYIMHDNTEHYTYPICPSPDYNILLTNIINKIKKPPLVYNSSMCTKSETMYYKKLTDNIYETIQTMSNKNYTYVPILDEQRKIIGVFSANVLLDKIKQKNGITVGKETTFKEIISEIKIENHSMEKFPFISKKVNIYDVKAKFEEYFSNDKIIGCLFITNNGEKSEEILGMITAWDVLGNTNNI